MYLLKKFSIALASLNMAGCILVPAPESSQPESLPSPLTREWQIDQNIKQDLASEGYIRETEEKGPCDKGDLYLREGGARLKVIWLFLPNTECKYLYKYNIKSTFKCRISSDLPLFKPLSSVTVHWKIQKATGTLQTDNKGAVEMYFAADRKINFHQEMVYSFNKDFSDPLKFAGALEVPPSYCEHLKR